MSLKVNQAIYNSTEHNATYDTLLPNLTELLPDHKNSTEHSASTLFLVPSFLILGIIGNSVSAAVMFRKPFRSMSLCVYLIVLAIADNATLLCNRLTWHWVDQIWGINLRDYSNISCKIIVYMSYTSASVSSWMIVAVSIEQVLVVSLPFRAKELMKKRRAAIAASTLVFVILALYSFIFKVVRRRYHRHFGQYKCMFISKNKWALYGVPPGTLLEFFNLCIYNLVPTVILLCANIVIIYKLVKSCEFRNLSQKGQPCLEACNNNIRRTTGMLIAVSSVFVILTLPLSFYLFYCNVKNEKADHTIETALFWMKIVNHAINFLLYSASGPAFQRELKQMFCERSSSDNEACSSPIMGSKVKNDQYVIKQHVIDEKIPLKHV